jgi:hypothetical protein
MSDIIEHAQQSIKDDTKQARTDVIEKVKMPAGNPAMKEMSLFFAEAWKRIMVKDLQAAIAKKLREF